MSTKNPRVAVVGATGAVGREMLSILEQRNFPASEIVPFASSRSVGIKLPFAGEELTVVELKEDSFKGFDLALFSAGGGTSTKFAPLAAEQGCVVVDNSSAWRMDPKKPLVVPEVNPQDLDWHDGIIANPNCSTIQMVVALQPIHKAAKIKRIVVSTYQAVSGSGQKAINELETQVSRLFNGKSIVPDVYPHQIAFNCLPQIDVFLDNGYTKEEMKMVNETVKIMGDESIKVTATTVRVPVFYAHSEAVNIETEKKLTPEECRNILAGAPGITVADYPEKSLYPMAIEATGEDDVFVGRIREDFTVDNGLNMWIVSDNIRKGAALNTIQIAETLIERDLLRVP
ncbi:aspartate-semialdehyde dehydrogenase [Maridesulfovibrio bastinii]|jgi:aspartate-semialdehyde dehydrogenase|uniref:aspartate-semialdehyde dehydrogenase n=1 Tax=Maridesulfovibrio bastinii TaxID=47157 RepID=UPI0003F4F93E|nr:aspartate-semialdehyde dehydrogenase [Maridesulfovibrio bastinii]